jgi:tRNA threonylcarbamoyladenosine biosynthesis protein TsaE
MVAVASVDIKDTRALGVKLGRRINQPVIIAFYGGLGAGKTTLIQSICKGLGVEDYVTSPSFTLINEYRGRLLVYHVDLYRLESLPQVVELGLEEYLEKDGVILIEWAEKLGKMLPRSAEKITIEITKEKERCICLSSGLAALLKS